MNYTQEQAKKIYQSAKDQGLNPDLVMAKLVEKGATFEGIDSNAAMQYSNKLLGKEGPGYLQRVGTDIKEQALRAKQGAEQGAAALEQGVNMTDANGIITPKGVATAVGGALRSGLRAAGSAANAIATPIVEAPGVKQATQAVVGGAMKGIQELPGGAEAFQKLRDLAVKNPEIAKDVEDIFNLVTVGGGAKVAKVGAEGAIGVAKAGEKAVGQGLESGMKLAENVIPKSDEIMNRVARLTPKQATTFEKLAGKTHGEYLRETGNFGTPDQIIKNEAEKFTQSLTDKKAALAELPGVYKEGSVTDALEMLVEKAKSESSPNVKSPYLEQVLELQRKNDTTGLSMLESENVKSLLERNVKLGYNKLMNPKEVTQATNIDNAIREWQVNKAKELGFENIAELNKQTQLSKFIVDKLGDQVVGKNGLNDVTLTDWIMLSGGDPTAVGGFLTKKFFSSKKVQSKIAEMLNKGEVKGQIVPKVTTSKKLPQQQSEKVLEKASTNNTTSGLKSKGTIPENSLISEAKKYKSAEEFVKSQPTVYRGEGGSNVAQGKALLAEGKHYASDAEYPKGFGKVEEYVLKPKAKVLDLGDSTFAEISQKLGIPERNYISPKELASIAKEKGYDVVKYTGEYKSTGKQFIHTVDLTGDSYITKSQLEEIWKKANKNVEIEPLIQQAKKYKSAEEFVKAQGTPVYHGTKSNIDIKDLSAQTESRGQYLGNGIYFTKYKEGADFYGGKTLSAIVNEKDFLNISNLKGIERTNKIGSFGTYKQYLKNSNLDDTLANFKKWQKNQQEVADKILNMGYKGVTDGQQHVIFDKSAIKTKSQLEEIWKKANKK